MPTHPAPVPNRIGPYELVSRIASGGMAEVFLARRGGPHGFEKFVAVKRILPQYSLDPEFVAMFIDEARVCARLAHPNIVQVFDFGEDAGQLYMAMEYVEGTTAARLIRATAARHEQIPLEVSVHVALSVLRALQYAHNARDENGQPLGIVHRDVSPGNVLIDKGGSVKLTDFGIARAAEFERRTDTGQLKGKLGYMSPEQVLGHEVDARSDLFTLGIVLTEMVILRPLFLGGRELDQLLRIRDADVSIIDQAPVPVPSDIRTVLHRALARDLVLRYPDAAAFIAALEEIVARRRLAVGLTKTATWLQHLELVDIGDPDDKVVSTIRLDVPAALNDGAASDGRATTPAQESDVCPKIYRVKFDDGTVLGPLSYPRVVELFATGRIGEGANIARETESFRPSKLYPEFKRFASSPALRWDEPWPREAIQRFSAARIALPSRLFELSLARETGVLMFKGSDERKKIYLLEGVPEFVASSDKRELLGEMLIARGSVLRMELEMALAMLPRFGGRLGDALVGLGILRPVELFRAVHDQMRERFVSALKWQGGELYFVRGVRSHEETFPLALDPFELIVLGVRAGYLAEELTSLLDPLGEAIIEPVEHPPVRVQSVRLEPREARILKLLSSPTTLQRLIAHASQHRAGDPDEVLRVVFIGLSVRFLRSKAWDDLLARGG